MSTPQGPNLPQRTPPGEPSEQPEWGQQPPGGWGQAKPESEPDPDETGAVPTQGGPQHEPPPPPAEFGKPRQHNETVPAMPPYGQVPRQQPSPPGQPPQQPQLPQHGLPQLGQPTVGVPLFGQPPLPGQAPYGQPSFGRGFRAGLALVLVTACDLYYVLFSCLALALILGWTIVKPPPGGLRGIRRGREHVCVPNVRFDRRGGRGTPCNQFRGDEEPGPT